MPEKINTKRLLLTKVRAGNYAHAGGQESTIMVIKHLLQLFPHIQAGNCLDVGCGFGGTANDFIENDFKHVYGIDIDSAAIDFAKKHYPKIKFAHLDAFSIPEHFPKEYFSSIFMFNVLYAIEHKKELFKKFAIVAKPGAILTLFDIHVITSGEKIGDFSGKPIYPMDLAEIKQALLDTGWSIIETVDLTKRYISWYQELLQELAIMRDQLLREFSEKDYLEASKGISEWLTALEKNHLGAVVIYAKK